MIDDLRTGAAIAVCAFLSLIAIRTGGKDRLLLYLFPESTVFQFKMAEYSVFNRKILISVLRYQNMKENPKIFQMNYLHK